MEKTDLVLFNKEKVRDVLTQFDFEIVKWGGKSVVMGKDGEPIQCPTCKNELTVKKVGTVAHGSRLLFCDNPLCFATWVVEKKL